MDIPEKVAAAMEIAARRHGLPNSSQLHALVGCAESDMGKARRTLRDISISVCQEDHHIMVLTYEEKQNWWPVKRVYRRGIFTEKGFHYQKLGEPEII